MKLMLTSAQMLAQLLRSYERRGIDVSLMKQGQRMCDRNDAHWPTPLCLGGEREWPILKDGHILLDLLVSEEVQHLSFYAGDALKLLKMLPDELDSEVTMMFWALYKKWAGDHSRGKSIYRDPSTGETALLTRKDAEERGWVHQSVGKAAYKDPNAGQTAYLTKQEAEERGWVGHRAGKKHPQEEVECKHCGLRSHPAMIGRHHGDNCVEREGSWRWFKNQMRELDPTWHLFACGKWRRKSKEGGSLHPLHLFKGVPTALMEA